MGDDQVARIGFRNHALEKLAEALLSAPAHVSVKAKTNEGMGWIGKGEGIAVIAVAVLG